MDVAKRVALNTGFLYGKMLITMFISLYSTRLILSALGVEDFGIFNLVGGVIAMLSFLNAAMAMSTQRFLSFFIGAGEKGRLKAVFSSSVILHLIIGLSIVTLLEISGLFLFNGGLNIPEGRVLAAKLIFQFMIISTFFTINAVPYDAAINAHEDLFFEALTGILEACIKLGIAFWLISSSSDRLILYGILFSGMTILIRLIKSVFCYRKYEECKNIFKAVPDKKLFKEMFAFAGWNMFGSFCNVLKDQGIAIIMNVYLGVIVNAAYGVANQVNGQLNAFSSNINKALKPQIVKSEGSGERTRMLRLAMLTCKLSFFLLSFFALPLIFEMEYVLNLWLKSVPEYAVIFCQLMLLKSMVQQLYWGLGIAIQSIGIIKRYQIVMGSLLLLNIPLAIVLLVLGYSAYAVLAGTIIIELVEAVVTVYFARKMAKLNVRQFLFKTVFNSILAVLLASAISLLPLLLIEESFLRLLLTILTSSTGILLFGLKIGMSPEENRKILGLFQSFIKKLQLKNKNKFF